MRHCNSILSHIHRGFCVFVLPLLQKSLHPQKTDDTRHEPIWVLQCGVHQSWKKKPKLWCWTQNSFRQRKNSLDPMCPIREWRVHYSRYSPIDWWLHFRRIDYTERDQNTKFSTLHWLRCIWTMPAIEVFCHPRFCHGYRGRSICGLLLFGSCVRVKFSRNTWLRCI